MKLRSLLYDAGCVVCSGIAKDAEAEAKGWLRVKPLQDAEMRALLATHAPHLGRRPALVTQDGDRVTVDVGWKMVAKLGLGLGPVRGWRLLRRLAEERSDATQNQPGTRRSVLRWVGGSALAGVAGMVMAKPVGPAAQATLALSEERRDAVVAAVRAEAGVQVAEHKLLELGISRDIVQAVVLQLKEGGLLTWLFYADVTGRADRAGMLVHERSADGTTRVFFEVVEANSQELISPEGQVREGVLKVSQSMQVTAGADIVPYSKAQYVSCMAVCLVTQCFDDVLTCRRLIAMPLVLACMVARCGQPAYVCHRRCKWLW